MVDIKNMKFSLPDVVRICINVAAFAVMYTTVVVKLDTLIEAHKGKEAEDKQLHKEQTTDIYNLNADVRIQASRITILENKKSQ